MIDSQPVLYVAEKDPSTNEAIQMLERAGLRIHIKLAPIHYRAAYRTPVLFGLFNRYEGIDGIRIFVENATQSHAASNSNTGQDS